MAERDDQLQRTITLVSRVAAAQLVASHKNLADKVALLDRLGFDRAEIAVICDTTPATIRTRLSERRQKHAASAKTIEEK
jgi:DNA-directed RNA polymerase specialized sigma24 family protein